MFIRFVSGVVDAELGVEKGLFCAAYGLRDGEGLPEYELDRLIDLLGWFNVNLKSPSDFRLRKFWRMHRAVCWFKPTAHEYLKKARDVIAILENNGVYVRTIKSEKTGYVLYEDEAQVFAEPFADMKKNF